MRQIYVKKYGLYAMDKAMHLLANAKTPEQLDKATNLFGHGMILQEDFPVGRQSIQTCYGQWLEILDEMQSAHDGKDDGDDKDEGKDREE